MNSVLVGFTSMAGAEREDAGVAADTTGVLAQSTDGKALAVDLARLDGEMAAFGHEQAIAREHAKATEEEQRATNVLEAARSASARLRQALDGSCGASLWRACLYLFPFGICFAAEFALSWVTLPFVLNVRRSSPIGVALGLAPATALLVLEVVFARLIEDPWQKLRRAAQSRWPRAGAAVLMAVFLLALGAANVYTVYYLAEAREEISRVHHALLQDAEAAQTLDREVVRRAIILVSLVVTVDGALFALLGIRELRARGLARDLRSAEARETIAHSDLVEARAKLVESTRQLAQVPRLLELIRQRHVQAERVRLLREAQGRLASRSSRELVRSLLRAKLFEEVPCDAGNRSASDRAVPPAAGTNGEPTRAEVGAIAAT